MTSEPFKLNVAEIALHDYAAHLVLKPDHTVNFAALAGGGTETGAATNSSGHRPCSAGHRGAPTQAPRGPHRRRRLAQRHQSPSRIAPSARLRHQPEPNSAAGCRACRSTESERAQVAISGRLRRRAARDHRPNINPLAEKKHIDLAIKLSDLDLSAMSPYSGSTRATPSKRDNWRSTSNYLIDAPKLDAKNQVRIDQFTFGHAVESKDAPTLPVRLAVSLLQGSRRA